MRGEKRGLRAVKRRLRTSHRPGSLGDNAVVLVFLILLVIVIFFLGSSQSQLTQLEQDQKTLINALVLGNSVDNEKLLEMANTDYSQLRERLGIRSEFVIHFEDENGNLVEVFGRPCIGSGYAYVNGYRCDG